jgi:hypothetical protein
MLQNVASGRDENQKLQLISRRLHKNTLHSIEPATSKSPEKAAAQLQEILGVWGFDVTGTCLQGHTQLVHECRSLHIIIQRVPTINFHNGSMVIKRDTKYHLLTLTVISGNCFINLNLCSEASLSAPLPAPWFAAAAAASGAVVPAAAAPLLSL